MTQGFAKKSLPRLPNTSRVAKPQKAKNKKVSAKYTSGLITQTEALLSKRAGNMLLVRDATDKVEKTLKKGAGSASSAGKKKGGSNKFG